jgi:hypothetical protein
MKRRMEQINESIERYLRAMDTADRAEPEVGALKKERLQEKIEALKERMEQLKAIDAQMRATPDQQISLTDPDARSMKNREGGIVGYNVQTAVDAEHHLIVAHEVTNEGVDRDQLATMAEKAREAVGTEGLEVLADRGYYKSETILECTRSGITPIVPKTMTSNNLAQGRFDKQDFLYIPEVDEYRCPRRPAGDPTLHNTRERIKPSQVLVLGVPQVSDEVPLHDRRLPAHHALGARVGA